MSRRTSARRAGASPNDTRYPATAVLMAFVVAAASAGAVLALTAAGTSRWISWTGAAIGLLAALVALMSVKEADEWERAVVLRYGNYRGRRGPGLFFIVPFVDRIAYHIDQRIRATDFSAESCLTLDTVPVNVDAIAFWFVWDAEKAALEVQQYDDAVILSAQSALRDAIGKYDLAEMIQSRQEMGSRLQEFLDQKMHDWGITVQSVEIRDVVIPEALEDAMSRQAQAERERQARILLGTAETEIAAKFVEAAAQYEAAPVALNLRAMNMLYEGMVKRGSIMVVPSGLADSLNVGGVTGLAALAGATFPKPEGTGRPADPRPPGAGGAAT